MATSVSLADLRGGETLEPGTYEITGAAEGELEALLEALMGVEVPEGGYEPGSEEVTAGGLKLMCSEASEANCNVTIDDEGVVTVMGTILVVAEGGMFPSDDTGPDMAAIERATKAAATKRTAIGVEAAVAVADDEGLGGTGAPTDSQVEGEYNLKIEYDDGQKVTITVEGATAAQDTMFPEGMYLGDGLTMLLRDISEMGSEDTVEEVVIVATDIDPPDPKEFGMVHTLDVRVDGETATDAAPNDALIVAAANLAHVKADAFTAPDDTVGTIMLSFQHEVADDSSTTDVDESRDAAEIMGTYEGAMGTYKCNATGASCTVTVNTMGVVSAVSANDWIFIPASGETVDVPDDDYLHYGFWLKRTTDSDGMTTYDEVQTFAGSSVAASGSVSAVTGTATYKGEDGATGVYVRNQEYYPSTGKLKRATSGHFTADVMLKATFGQLLVDGTGTIAPNMLNTLTGTINDFELFASGDMTETPNKWEVKLDGTITPGTGTASGTTEVEDVEMPGSFSATFHGPAADTDGNPIHPHSVVGEFNADFGDGVAAGGFGARKPEMMEE